MLGHVLTWNECCVGRRVPLPALLRMNQATGAAAFSDRTCVFGWHQGPRGICYLHERPVYRTCRQNITCDSMLSVECSRAVEAAGGVCGSLRYPRGGLAAEPWPPLLCGSTWLLVD